MTRLLTGILLSIPLIGAYAMFAIGIVLIHQASRVLNLAHGAMAMIPAYVLYSLSEGGVPLAAALPLAIGFGGVLGISVERVFVRRLRKESLTTQTVGTVAALGILVALAAKIWGTAPLGAVRVFPEGFVSVGLSNLRFGEIGLFVVMLVLAVTLFLLLHRTDVGLKMRGVAESHMAASLHGVDPQRVTELTWFIGGALAATSGILLAGVTNLHPYVLALQVLPGFIAGLLAGLRSLPGAIAGAAVVGLTLGLVPVLGPVAALDGAPQLLLAVVAVVAMATRGKKLVAGGSGGAQ